MKACPMKPQMLFPRKTLMSSETLKKPVNGQKKSSSCTDLPQLLDRLCGKKSKDLPKLSAKSWALFDASSGKLLQGRSPFFKREVASLTKIMTLYVALSILDRLELDPNDLCLTVTREAAQIGGTSAELQEGDLLSVRDLFHGLMLPSGNDAAYTLGEYFGLFLFLEQIGRASKIKDLRDVNIRKDYPGVKDSMRYFINEMNETAEEMNLTQTYFNNVHGMSLKLNISSAHDMGVLTCKAIKHPEIQKISRTRGYIARTWTSEKGYQELFWENSNKLLDEGFEGVKTGVTPNAGPCLSALYRLERYDGQEQQIVVVVLKCEGIEDRFADVRKIVEWCKNAIF